MKRMKGDAIFMTLFLLPAGIVTGMFLYYPFIKGISLSFYRMNGFAGERVFSGFYNFIEMVKDSVVQAATLHSLELLFITMFFQVGIALALAVMVDRIKHGKSFFRTSFFFPVVISGTAIGLLFSLIYMYRGGMLNTILTSLGFDRVLWLSENTALIGVSIPIIWQYVGFYFVILLTAIMKIPDSFYEAGELEGINGWQRTVKITIPLILNDIKVVLILAITGSLRIFDIILVITGGGPAHGTEVLGTYMYQQTFSAGSPGYGSTIAVWIVMIGVAVSLITNRLLKQEDITY